MKTFNGVRPSQEIKASCLSNGWHWNQSAYDNGSDYVSFEFRSGRKRVDVLYNTASGRFIVKDQGVLVTEDSTKMEGVKWYAALLDFIYFPKAVAA
jgi:hypothetical protein